MNKDQIQCNIFVLLVILGTFLFVIFGEPHATHSVKSSPSCVSTPVNSVHLR